MDQANTNTMNKIKRFQKRNLPHNKEREQHHIHMLHWSHCLIIVIVIILAFCLIKGIIHHHEKVEAPTQGEKAQTTKVTSKHHKQIKIPKHADSYTRNKIIHENHQNDNVAQINKINSGKKK